MYRLLSEHLGEVKFHNKEILSGCDIHHTMKIDYGKHTIFVKQNFREFLPLFKQEAEQLKMLAKNHTINVPKVYSVASNKHHSFLLLEYFSLKSFDSTNTWYFSQQRAHLYQWKEQPSYNEAFPRLGSVTHCLFKNIGDTG